MVPEALSELVNVSDELAVVLNKPVAVKEALPTHGYLHPDLAAVISCGARGLQLVGVDSHRISDYTKRAKGRGLRLNVFIFGWHPAGHTWFAAPIKQGNEPVVIEIDRMSRLATKELSLTEFVEQCTNVTREALAEAIEEAATVEANKGKFKINSKPKPEVKRRIARVVIAENEGASVVGGNETDSFNPEDWGYVVWCLRTLKLLNEQDAPDLERWQTRALRSARLETVPKASNKSFAAYDEAWKRLSLRDRCAAGASVHQVPDYKFAAAGTWILAPNELSTVQRSDKATPPRHKHTDEQLAIWNRWVKLIGGDSVEITVR